METLIIEQLDRDTRSVCASWRVDRDEELISRILGLDTSDFVPGSSWELSPKELQQIKDIFNLNGQEPRAGGRIRHQNRLDQLSYRHHGGSELLLMLQGIKPLSFFSSIVELMGQPFEKYRKAGWLVGRSYTVKKTAVTYRIYARPGEEWRMEAFILLKEAAAESGWAEVAERIEGTLLGYTDAQMDEFLREIYRQ